MRQSGRRMRSCAAPSCRRRERERRSPRSTWERPPSRSRREARGGASSCTILSRRARGPRFHCGAVRRTARLAEEHPRKTSTQSRAPKRPRTERTIEARHHSRQSFSCSILAPRAHGVIMGDSMRTSISALHAWALAHLQDDEFALAARVIRRMLILLPPSHESRPSLLVTLAFAHHEAGEVDEARRVAEQATKLDPQNALAWQQVRRAERALKAS